MSLARPNSEKKPMTVSKDGISSLLQSARQGLNPGLDDKVVIVTGTSGGIGRNIAAFFAAAGSSVMLSDIRIDESAAFASELASYGHHAAAIATDVAKPD